MSDAATRVCRKCGAEKPLTAEFFSRHKDHAGGLNSQCKACRYEATKARKLADPERASAKQAEATAKYLASRRGTDEWRAKVKRANRRYLDRNPEKAREARAKWAKANPDKVKASIRSAVSKRPDYYKALSGKWQRENPEKARAKARAHRERKKRLDPRAFLDHDKAKSAAWRAENPDKVRTMNIKRYVKMKAEAGPAWIRQRISAAIRQSIINKLVGAGKQGSKWNQLVGYSTEDLISHVERQFRRGMRWSNWGKMWHLDHIQPVASFAFTSIHSPEFRACWALSNLRPIPVKENLSKSKKRLYLL